MPVGFLGHFFAINLLLINIQPTYFKQMGD